ncbi:M48 family metallopeptidase [Patescibacteria group bacterium]
MYYCKLIKSNRRTLSLTIEQDGTVTIRAPKRISQAHIDNFLKEKKKWIIKHIEKVKERQKQSEDFSQKIDGTKIPQYKKRARQIITERADHFSEKHNLPYKSIRLSSAKTRWGSCGPTNNLNFNWIIMFAPPEVVDYLVVHELAHTKHRHHQKSFWKLVEEIDPGYKKNRKWLRDNAYLLSTSF